MPTARSNATKVATAVLVTAGVVTGGFFFSSTKTNKLDSSNVIDRTPIATFTNRGVAIIAFTNTGGRVGYTAASFQNTYTGTGIVKILDIDVYKAPNAPQYTCVTSPNGTSTGSVIFKYKASGSGQVIVASGAALRIIPPNWYIRCWASKTPDTAKSNNAALPHVRGYLEIREMQIP